MKEKKKTIIIVLIFTMILIGALVIIFLCWGKDDKSSETKNQQEKYENTFKYDPSGSYGIAYVTGYAKVTRRPYCGAIGNECTEQNSSSINDEVEFFVTKTSSEDLKEEINSWYGELYEGEKTIGLGCKKDNTIFYVNTADEFQDSTKENIYGSNFKTYTLSSDDTNKIINSSENNPIVLKLTKLKLTSGGGAPSCYCHFAHVEVVE